MAHDSLFKLHRLATIAVIFALFLSLVSPANTAKAAVTVAMQPTDNVGQFSNLSASSADTAVAYFDLAANNNETLSTVTVTLVDANGSMNGFPLAASDFNALKLWRDNGSGTFSGTGDTLLTSCPIATFASGTSTKTLSGNNCDGATALAAPLQSLAVRYFITVSTSATWSDHGANQMWNPNAADAFTVNMGASSIVTSIGLPNITALNSMRMRFADNTGPQVMNAFVPPYATDGKTVEVFFSEMLSKSSLECSSIASCAAIYTLSGGINITSAAAMSTCPACTHLDSVKLTLGSAATNNTTTLTMAGTLTDNVGNAMSTSAATLRMNFPPMVKGLRKVSNNSLILEFDQAMQSGTACGGAENPSAYTITVDGATLSGHTLTLSNGNILTIAKNNAFTNAGVGGNDYIDVKTNPGECGTPMNTDGLKVQGNGHFMVDADRPNVLGLTKDNTSNKVWIKFNEQVDNTTATAVSNYADDSAVHPLSAQLLWYNPPTSPTWMTPDMMNKVVELSFTSVAGLNTKITVNNVKDMSGNIIDPAANTAELAGSTAIAIAAAGVSATMTNGSWNAMLDGCSDTFGNTSLTCNDNATNNYRDAVTIPFTGAIDTAFLGENNSGIIPNIGSFLEIYDSWTYGSQSSDCVPGHTWSNSLSKCVGKNYANLDQSYGVVIDNEASNYEVNTNGIANDVLIIYLKGFVNIMDNMTINPFGIKGLNGLTATQNITESKNKIPRPTFAGVIFVKSVKAGANFADGDTVTFFFSDDMRRTDVDDTAELASKIMPQQMMPWLVHSWGTGGSLAVSWGNHNGSVCTLGGTASDTTPDCLKVTLGNSPTVVTGDEVMINGLNSTLGMPIGFGGKIDTIAPTATATLNATLNTVTIVFSEEMIEIDGDNDYSNNITYSGAGGSTNAAIDATYDAEGFTNGIKLVSENMNMPSGGGTADGNGWQPIKKFQLKLTAEPEASDEVSFTNFTDNGGNAASGTISPSADAVAPTICKVIQNDWNNDRILNGGDEIILIFDNESPANSSNGCNSDLDYTTISNLNSDFIVKRSNSPLTNPFGQGANFWVDQWDRHAGELHINLGQGANIQANDTIWAGNAAVADLSGNAMDHTAAQTTLSSSQAGEITKIIYADNGAANLSDADTFAIYFSTPIDPYSLGTYNNNDSTVTNLDWGLPLEHNFEMNPGAYTFGVKTWGSASTGLWNGTFDRLTITVGGGNASFADNDLAQTWPVVTANGNKLGKPGHIDMTGPALSQVKGNLTLGANNVGWDNGDKLTFIFSEPMTEGSLRVDSVSHAMTDVGITNGHFGSESTFSWLDPEKKVLEVTLGTTDMSIATGSTVFDPAGTVTDLNGNADETAAPVSITVSSLPVPTSVVAVDSDTTNPSIDGRDLTITWNEATGANKYLVYVIPNFVRFDASIQNPIGLPTSSACTAGTCTWTGPSTLNVDSRSTNASGQIDTSKPFFPFNNNDNYDVFVIASNTAGTDRSFEARTTSSIRLSMEYGSDGQAPWVEGAMPWDGKTDVPLNNGKLSIKFSEAMNRNSVETLNNILLQKKGTAADWSDATNVSAYTSYDEANRAAMIKPASALDANSNYRIKVTTNVTDQGGTALTSAFYTHFKTSGSSDTTSPKVSTYFVDGQTVTTNIPRNSFSASIAFDEEMDPSSFTDTSVTLSPNIANSSVWYDPFMRSLNYVFGGPLAQNITYTLTVSGIYVKDAAGNTLDGDGNGTGAGTTSDNYTLSFTTVDEALGATKPRVAWIDSDSKSIKLGFSERMDKAKVENRSNWVLKRGSTIVDLQTATFFYDGFVNELRVDGINLTAGEQHTLTPSTSVLAMNGQDIITANDCADPAKSCLSFTPWSDSTVFNANTISGTAITGMQGTFNGGMFSQMADGNTAANNIDVKMFMPINAWPMNQTEGKTTNYHFSLPTTKAIVNGGEVLLKFPTSFNITSTAIAKDSGNKLFMFNQDVNGPGGTMTAGSTFNPTGRVQIANITANNQTKTITLKLAVDDGTGCTLDSSTNDETPVYTGTQNATDNSIYGEFMATCTDTNQTSTTMPYDFLDFELAGIVNGDASEVDWMSNTGGYQVEITSKNSAGQTLEGPIKTMRFGVKKAGNGAISGKATAVDGVTPIQNARVFLDSPLAGHVEQLTDASGNYSFSALPIAQSSNAWDGWYHVMIEAPSESDYTGNRNFDIQLTSTSPTSTGNNASFTSAGNTITFTVTHTDDALDNLDISVWAGSPNKGWKNKKITLEADGSTTTTMKVDDGAWDFGVGPWFEATMFGGGPMEMAFMPPRPTNVQVDGNESVSFALTTASYSITGKVTDGTAGLANVNVYAYDPSGNGFGGGGAQTAPDGSYKLKVANGTYVIGANKPGLPMLPEQTVTVNGSNVSNINFAMVKAGSSISGSVTDGTNALPFANINAWTSDGRNAWSSTDQQGSYTIFLAPGTWTLEAFAPGYGRVDLASGVTDLSNVDSADGIKATVTVAADSTTSGVNFSVASATYYTISGQVRDSATPPSGIANVSVRVEEVNATTGVSVGNNNDVRTDASGNFNIKVKANSANNRYRLSAWHTDYGDLKPDSSTLINVASSNSTGNNFTAPSSYNLTISITNGNAIEKATPPDLQEAFVDVFCMQSNVGNHKRFESIELTDGANNAVGIVKMQQTSNCEAKMHIPGIGGFSGTLGGSSSFSVTGNATLTFNLGLSNASSVITLSGTVTDGTNPVSNAWVSAHNVSTFNVFDTSTDASGNFSIKVPSGTYTVRADKPGYGGDKESDLSATTSSIALTLATAGSSISGTVYLTGGVTPATPAFVWGEQIGGDGWVGDEVDNNGAFTLGVPAGTSWNISAQNKTGSHGTKATATSAGASGANITMSSTVAGAAFISNEPFVKSVTPANGGVFDDSDNTGVELILPANALGTSNDPGNVSASETASAPETGEFHLLGDIAKEVTATDSEGNRITTLDGDATLKLVYAKDEMENFTGASDSATQNGLEELNDLQNSYWDSTAQNWVPITTTKTVYVKDDAADSWRAESFDTFFANVTGDGSNTANGGGTQSDFYDDYKVTLASATDHFTVFGTIIGSDLVPPAMPTDLVATASNGSVSLDWTNNSEGDLLEYQVFRGTTSGFTCDDDSQINLSAVTSSAYTDSTPTDNTSYDYFYKIKAVDNSGNLSTCTSGAEATYTYSSGDDTPPSGGGGGGGGSARTPDTNTAYSIPDIASETTLALQQKADFLNTNGIIKRPISLENPYNYQKITIANGTTITNSSDGSIFRGTLDLPRRLLITETPSITDDFDIVETSLIGATNNATLKFSQPFTLKIPFTLEAGVSATNLKVYYYDSALSKFIRVNDGGTVDTTGKFITVPVDHMTIFAVIDTKGQDLAEIAASQAAASVVTADNKDTNATMPFLDIVSHWANSFVSKLYNLSIVSGRTADSFAPDLEITRAELLKIALKGANITVPSSVTAKPFTDVATGAWFAPYIEAAKAKGIISGYADGTFGPNNPVTRAEALKIIMKTANKTLGVSGYTKFSDVPVGQWFAKYVATAFADGIVSGYEDSTFRPNNPVTRAEASKMVVETIGL